MTARPITANEAVSVQLLHALMRTYDFYTKLAVNLIAGVFVWSESKSSINHQFLQQAKTRGVLVKGSAQATARSHFFSELFGLFWCHCSGSYFTVTNPMSENSDELY